MHIVAVFIASFIVVYLSLLWFRSKLLEKSDWTSDVWIIEISNKYLLLLWLGYFTVRLVREASLFASFEQRTLAVFNYIKTLIGVNSFWRPVDVLFGLTLTWGVYSLIYMRIKKCDQYDILSPQEFPEYDFPFQRDLVDFLNRESKFGQNTYWLDGGWGTGKTHFLRTFFQKQRIKKLEIYYVSCFGIRTREQAEQVLIREIEERSSFGSLDQIPVVGSLVKWGFATLGLNLMKKDSVVIFDDLERVAYSETGKDDPKDYNDLLGFIDYLGNHKNQKVIVVYDSNEMTNTKKEIVDKKFAPKEHKMPSVDEVIEQIISDKVRESGVQSEEFIPKFLEKIYKLKYISFGIANFRRLVRDFENYIHYNVDSFYVEEEVKELVKSSLNDFISSKHLRLIFGELQQFYEQVLKEKVDRDDVFPKIHHINSRIIDSISTHEAYEIWNSYVELLEFLEEYAILDEIDLPVFEGLDLSYDDLEADFDYINLDETILPDLHSML